MFRLPLTPGEKGQFGSTNNGDKLKQRKRCMLAGPVPVQIVVTGKGAEPGGDPASQWGVLGSGSHKLNQDQTQRVGHHGVTRLLRTRQPQAGWMFPWTSIGIKGKAPRLYVVISAEKWATLQKIVKVSSILEILLMNKHRNTSNKFGSKKKKKLLHDRI